MEKFKKSVKKDQNTEFSALFGGGGVIENRLWQANKRNEDKNGIVI